MAIFRTKSRFLEYYETGKIDLDPTEIQFLKEIKEEFNIDIAFADLSKNDIQSILQIYIKFTENQNKLANEIQEYLKLSNSRDLLESSSNNIIDFADKALNKYCNLYDIQKKDLLDTYLVADNFYEGCLARTFSLSIQDVKYMIYEKHNFNPFNLKIFVWYEPSITCIFYKRDEYERMQNIRNEVILDAINIMKKYDKIGFLTPERVNLKILFKEDIDKNLMNSYCREF